jgi:hypothetical protein
MTCGPRYIYNNINHVQLVEVTPDLATLTLPPNQEKREEGSALLKTLLTCSDSS